MKNRIFHRRDIKSCEGEPYLTRWTLLRLGPFALFLHKFHASDEDRALHDHPWTFLSLILWGGYWEHTPKGKKRIRPGMILYRPAEWLHRVELRKKMLCEWLDWDEDIPAWTLVFHFARRRKWGFRDPEKGWIHWRDWHNTNLCVEEESD